MKMRTLALSVFATLFAFTACKKDSQNPTPTPGNDVELLGPQTGKVLHYSFNGNLNDGSGNNLTASAAVGTASFTSDRFGRSNQALLFTGATSPVGVATPSISSKITGFPFAISLWFKATSVSNSQTLVRTAGGESTNYSGAWLQLGVGGEGTMSFSFGNNTGVSSPARNSITTSALFSANNWYHVVINVRGADDMDVYVNGVKDNNGSYSGSATTMVYDPNFSTGFLGIYPGASSNFDGMMDDYRVYSKVLTPTEISTLYNFQP